MNGARPSPVDVYVSAGSNVVPKENLRRACAELHKRVDSLDISGVYGNGAGGISRNNFLNLVLRFRTAESPAAIIAELERLHVLAGRVRGPDPFSSRTLDLDLLLYGDAVLPDPAIRVPREDIRKYAFVLGPLAELAPALRHPVTGETMAELWAGFDQAAHPLQRVSDPSF